jgi:hypothetical protein
MNQETDWVKDCQRWHGVVLTGNFQHWCPDWDFLPIDDTCEEFAACTCPKVEPDIVQTLRQASLNNDDYRWQAANEIERLRAALEWIDKQRYTDRRTITPDNAVRIAFDLNEKLLVIMDRARAALNPTPQDGERA